MDAFLRKKTNFEIENCLFSRDIIPLKHFPDEPTNINSIITTDYSTLMDATKYQVIQMSRVWGTIFGTRVLGT